MTYYLERWDYEKRGWEVLARSKNKTKPDEYTGIKLKDNDRVVVTKSFLGLFKQVVAHYHYYNKRFTLYKFQPVEGVAERNAAEEHYYFIWFWVIYNKIPKIFFKILTVGVIPTFISIAIYLNSENLELTISVWAALISTFTMLLTVQG